MWEVCSQLLHGFSLPRVSTSYASCCDVTKHFVLSVKYSLLVLNIEGVNNIACD
jgi:hypothetical protein